jgi:hypothetical protein
MFQAVPPPIIRSTKLYIVRPILLPAAIVDKLGLACPILSTIAAGSCIGLISDAVCTVLCS